MELPDLRFLTGFAAIYETRSLTRAAGRLRRTQPTVTYQLRRLEELVGAPLFVRDRAGVVPTAVADGLYSLVRRLSADLADLRGGGTDPERALSIASVSGFGRYVLAPLLRRAPFEAQRVTLRFPVAEEVVQRTVAGDVDLGFVFRPVAHAGLVVEQAFEATYVLVAAPAWARRLRTQARFVDVPLITYDEGDYVIGRWLGHHFGRRPPRWHAADHFEELEEVLDSVAAGRGVAVVPGVCLPAWRGAVREVRWQKPPVLNTVYSLRPARAPVRPAVAALLAELARLGA
jgi:LysR family transcriptional regulator, cyn operon transcriptional activator